MNRPTGTQSVKADQTNVLLTDRGSDCLLTSFLPHDVKCLPECLLRGLGKIESVAGNQGKQRRELEAKRPLFSAAI